MDTSLAHRQLVVRNSSSATNDFTLRQNVVTAVRGGEEGRGEGKIEEVPFLVVTRVLSRSESTRGHVSACAEITLLLPHRVRAAYEPRPRDDSMTNSKELYSFSSRFLPVTASLYTKSFRSRRKAAGMMVGDFVHFSRVPYTASDLRANNG